MAKLIFKVVRYCAECPYIRYDAHYSLSRDSGYDCGLSGGRIIDDSEIKENTRVEIPSWCELDKETTKEINNHGS